MSSSGLKVIIRPQNTAQTTARTPIAITGSQLIDGIRIDDSQSDGRSWPSVENGEVRGAIRGVAIGAVAMTGESVSGSV